ncbi:MAG: hypothetical protein PHQ65_07705 [Bacteroidales bacterium]|nr:hypothetical protein [Bacteroidales bacterium]MDD3665134.1 hypothetical protein [Bacteroidales bacterium]
MNRFWLVFFPLFAVLSLNAQFVRDELVLKSGKIVKGSIIKHIPQTSVEVLLADSSTIVIAYDEIERIVNQSNPSDQQASDKPSWIIHQIQLGFCLKANSSSSDFLKLRYNAWWPLAECFSVGLGGGVHVYGSSGMVLWPLLAGGRLSWSKAKLAPFVDLLAGYSLDGSNGMSAAGLLLSPSAGIKYLLSDEIGFALSIGLERQYFRSEGLVVNPSGGYRLNREGHHETGFSINLLIII